MSENIVNYAVLLIDDSCNKSLLRFFLLRNNLLKGTIIYNFCINDELRPEDFEANDCFDVDGISVQSFSTGSRSNIDIIRYALRISNVAYILYSHHDVCNLTKTAYEDLNNELYLDKYKNAGLIGFNIFHDSEALNSYTQDASPGSEVYSTTSRCALQRGDGYYRKTPGSTVDYSNFINYKPFEIEIPFWVNCVINKENFQRTIDKDTEFDFHLAFDYIAMSFLRNDIPNICIPYISFAHQQEIKILFDKRVKSPFKGDEKVSSTFGRQDAHVRWVEEFGFPFNFEKVCCGIGLNHHYLCKYLGERLCKYISNINTKATYAIAKTGANKLSKLQKEFYLHDPSTGPKSYF